MLRWTLRNILVLWLLCGVLLIITRWSGAAIPASKIAYFQKEGGFGAYIIVDLRTAATYELPLILGDARIPLWSPDGRYLYYRDRTNAVNETDIFIHDTHTGEARHLIADPFNQFPVVIAPDGKWLIYISETVNGFPLQYYLYDLEAHEDVELLIELDAVTGAAPAPTVAWSPDSRYIAFTQGLELNLYDIEADEYTALAKGETATNPRWSMDGRQIAYTTFDIESEIRAYDLDTYDITTLATGFEQNPYAYLNPDWSQIAYLEAIFVETAFQDAVLLREVVSGEQAQLLQLPINNRLNRQTILGWLDNETLRYAIAYDDDTLDLMWLNIQTGERGLLYHIPAQHFALWWD